MKLTDSQREAVQHDGNTLLRACPGSGKTRAIIAKLLHCVDEVRDTARRIGCITYTNTAVDEIEYRLGIYGVSQDLDHCEISTIHTFCLQNILGCFYSRVPQYRAGYSVVSSETERYQELAAAVCKDHGLNARAREKLAGGINRELDGRPSEFWPLTEDAVMDFWERLEAEQLIDFTNIIYQSYVLIRDHENIAQWLSRKFTWLLVDEFQDTSPLQVEILKLIADAGHTRFFLVGDPHQSIFAFNGAKPALMPLFSDYIDARTDIVLRANWRSSSRIVGQAHCLLPRHPAMEATGRNRDFGVEPSWHHGETAFDAVVDYFLPALENHAIPFGKAAILASTWFPLRPLGRQLREYGIPVVGPGASPYRRSRVFGPLAEVVCGYIANSHPKTFDRIDRQLVTTLSALPNSVVESISSHRRRVAACRLIQAGIEVNTTTDSGSEWLYKSAEAFSAILIEEGMLLRQNSELLSESVKDMHRDMERNGIDIPNLSVADLGMLACPEKNMKLLTIHGSKGREFDAVAIVDLHNGKFPSFFSRTEAEHEENTRLLYVAVTRAERILMYITNDCEEGPSPFIDKLLQSA